MTRKNGIQGFEYCTDTTRRPIRDTASNGSNPDIGNDTAKEIPKVHRLPLA